MVKNRNPVGMWFITFPQSNLSKGEFLKKVWTDTQLLEYAVCEETHEDGKPHLHANIKLRYKISYATMLSKIKKSFPNDYKRIDFRTTRQSVSKAIDGYLTKEDDKEKLFIKVVKKEFKPKGPTADEIVMRYIHSECQRKGGAYEIKYFKIWADSDPDFQESVRRVEAYDRRIMDLSLLRRLGVIFETARFYGKLSRLFRQIMIKSNNVMCTNLE